MSCPNTKKNRNRILAVSGLLFLGFSTTSDAFQNRAELVPFSIETYMAVTKKTLLERPGRQCSLIKPGAIESLLEKSKETSKRFEDGRVRGLIEERGATVFVDAEGVFEYGSKNYLVEEKDLRGVLNDHFKCRPSL